MKHTKWWVLKAGLAVAVLCAYGEAPAQQIEGAPPQAPAPATPQTTVSPSVAEVIRLAESGTGEDVVVAYIQNSPATFNLTADNILYLKDVGVTSAMITAMLNHDSSVRNQPLPPAPAEQQPPPPSQPPPPQEAPPAAS